MRLGPTSSPANIQNKRANYSGSPPHATRDEAGAIEKLYSYSSNNLTITRNSSILHGDRSTNISKDPKDVIKNYKHSNVNSESNPVSVASFRQFLDDLAWHES